jgi:hypothetical protein
MEAHLTLEQKALGRLTIEHAEILAAVDQAEASLARCEGRVITQESMRQLAEEVKHRGRARLAAEQTPPRSWHTVSRRKRNRNRGYLAIGRSGDRHGGDMRIRNQFPT